MTKFYKDFDGTTARIVVHWDGSARLIVSQMGKKTRESKHKNEKSAYNAWRRMCS